MERRSETVARTLDFGDLPTGRSIARGFRNGLRLATPSGDLCGPDKYRVLDLRRRRAQIRARRALSRSPRP
jgi:hypothetical protein